MNLLELPSELIVHIFAYLDDRDVFDARLSNKVLEASSFSHFAKRFFRKRGFMITSHSLDCLKQIAGHEQLRKHVQHVWFNPDCYTFARPECAPDDEDTDMDDADELITPADRDTEAVIGRFAKLAKQYEAYQRVMRDNDLLLNGNKLELELAGVFGMLPNLMTVGMRRSEDYSPYGWTLLRDAIGEDPRVLGPIPSGPVVNLSGPTHLFIALIKAIATSGAQLQRLYTDAIEIDNIKSEILPQSTLETACGSVLYLELNAVKGWLNTWRDLSAQPYTTLRRPESFGTGLIRLLSATRNLKEIGLQIFPDRKQSHLVAPTARNPDSWRLSYPYVALQKLASSVTLSHLSRVKLEKVTTTSSTLISFLRPAAENLESLKIRDIRLLSSNQTSPVNPSIFTSSSTSDDMEPRPWETFFSFLHSSYPVLRYVLFYHLMHDRGTISFTEDAPSPMPIEEADFLVNHVPSTHGGKGSFAKYENIMLEVEGKELVKSELERVANPGGHWYHGPLFSYAMDEGVWHTDTDGEEW